MGPGPTPFSQNGSVLLRFQLRVRVQPDPLAGYPDPLLTLHNRYSRKLRPMPEDVIPSAGQDLGALAMGIAGTQRSEGGYCHGVGARVTVCHSDACLGMSGDGS